MLDSLTRFDLQDTLLDVWEQQRKTVVMVTHDVDEALYLADRLILMTDGPAATVGEILSVPFRVPADDRRAGASEYYACHQRVLDFLEHHAHQSKADALSPQAHSHHASLELDVVELVESPTGASLSAARTG